jgi:hypothetical protein
MQLVELLLLISLSLLSAYESKVAADRTQHAPASNCTQNEDINSHPDHRNTDFIQLLISVTIHSNKCPHAVIPAFIDA